MRGPLEVTFGTPCSKARWHAPPITSRSPDAGARSVERPPTASGRTRNGRRAPSVTIATSVSSRSRSSRSAVERHAVAPVAVVVERRRRRTRTPYRVPSAARMSAKDGVGERVAVAVPARQARVVEHAVVHARGDPGATRRVSTSASSRASAPRSQLRADVDPRAGVEVDARSTGASASTPMAPAAKSERWCGSRPIVLTNTCSTHGQVLGDRRGGAEPRR